MGSLIMAFPYEVPVWLPDALVFLSRYISDPAPIKTTIKHTFAEFRRTHQDTWHEDVLRGSQTHYGSLYDFSPAGFMSDDSSKAVKRKKGIFTPAHLDALEGLLSGSVNYYA